MISARSDLTIPTISYKMITVESTSFYNFRLLQLEGVVGMKYAVDRYMLGHEQEVAAESFLLLSCIPRRTQRFYCPECGETVFFRAKGNGEFYHQKQIEGITPECDKRVDGRSGLSLYERAGLSMYIVSDTWGQYRLGISFPPLGKQALDAAAQQKAEVRITAHGQECRFRVSPTLFFADQSTLLPIDFLPPAGENYSIEIKNTVGIVGIRQKWANYADGFKAGGAFFHYGVESGRKIRRGDSISTGRPYYLVTEQSYDPPHSEIQTEQVGSIRLKSGKLSVSKFIVNVSTENENRYRSINNHLNSRFGVWLLDTAPELTTLWPPTVLQQDTQVPLTSVTRKLYCSVSSGNDTPNVYFYDDLNYGSSDPQPVIEGGVILPFYRLEIAASVDRKYVGRETFYRRSLLPAHTFSYEIKFEDANGCPLDLEDSTQTSLIAAHSVNANAKMELWIGCKGKLFQHIAIRENTTPMPALECPEEVYQIIKENDVCSLLFYCHTRETASISHFDDVSVLTVLKKHRYGPLVPVPAWVACFVRDCSKRGNIMLARFVCGEISGSKIPLGFLNALFSMKKAVIGDGSK